MVADLIPLSGSPQRSVARAKTNDQKKRRAPLLVVLSWGGQTRRDGCGEGDSGRTKGDADRAGGKLRGQAARRCDAPPHVVGGGVAEALHDSGFAAHMVGIMMKMVVADGGHGAARQCRRPHTTATFLPLTFSFDFSHALCCHRSE
ncbi:hypothetical protein SESBI_26669 [Sesbania bispinosa]|nr:hypothetical protein SESBI_26669 [Sesbania bispinosa]